MLLGEVSNANAAAGAPLPVLRGFASRPEDITDG